MDKKPAQRESIPAQARRAAGKANAARLAKTGLTSRIRGHVSARGRRAQMGRNIRKRAVR